MTALYLILLFVVLFIVITNLPVFGQLPSGSRLDLIKHIPSYRDGAIQNLSFTPMQPEGVSMFTIAKSFFFEKHPDRVPLRALPSVQPDLNAANGNSKPEITWFGHSSYLIKADQYKILVDPVFSQRPSPFSFIGSKAFLGTDFVRVEDFPALDVILITHDHYDHLDYHTILILASRTTKIVCSLGVGSHLEKWGIPSPKIHELAWNESVSAFEGLEFTAVPARHFTGRRFKRNQTLWSAFVLQTSNSKLFLGGDSGYDTHFASIGATYGPFDLALLECGQYNAYWPFIHMFPEQTVQAAVDLKAKVLMPVHWGKFSLAMHPWNEPIRRVVAEGHKQHVDVVTPMLGQKFVVGDSIPQHSWWED